MPSWPVVLTVLAALAQIAGVLSAVRAILETRTAQGATAWAISLVLFPYLAVPLYWFLGSSKFEGYVLARHEGLVAGNPTARAFIEKLFDRGLIAEPARTRLLVPERLAILPLTTGNDAELLIDGEATFRSILDGIARAKHTVLAQFYLVRDDEIGRAFQRALVEAAARGVRCYLLVDPIGSIGLPSAYLEALREAGVHTATFDTNRRRLGRFQINFRNHRKILVIDGDEAWVGGHNCGDEYLGRDPEWGVWRDTHVHVEGPVADCVQVAFFEDWLFATGESLDLTWDPKPAKSGARCTALALPTGPADELETCTLFFVHAIHSAQRRLWIASPYFVPDEQFITALSLAALRGVDVRVLVPERTDSKLVQLSEWSYLEELGAVDIPVFRYQRGFMHHKVVLIDDEIATIGTANFDNRSFRLNFEITMLFVDRDFAARVALMLEEDFRHAIQATPEQLRERRFWYQLAVRAARLLAPIQ